MLPSNTFILQINIFKIDQNQLSDTIISTIKICMGKRQNNKPEDPILSKNPQHERRKRQRLQEKMQRQQQALKEKAKRQQILQIKRKVDGQIEQQLAKAIKKNNLISKQKERMYLKLKSKKVNQQSSQNFQQKTSLKKLTLQIKDNQKQAYRRHFTTEVQIQSIQKQFKRNKAEEISQEVQKNIRSMFGVAETTEQEIKQKQLKRKQQQENNSYNLKKSLKIEEDILLNGKKYEVSKNFIKNAQNITIPIQQSSNLQLAILGTYVDSTYIENKQEQTLDIFRTAVIKHSLNHIRICHQSEQVKSLGYNSCKVLILTPYIADAHSLMQILRNELQDYTFQNYQKIEQYEQQNDFFRIGINIDIKKKKARFFSKLIYSEIVIASPLSLVVTSTIEDKQKQQTKVDFSFLSSVEIAYLDRASAILMQNWSHVVQVYKNMNIMPKYESLTNSIENIRQIFIDLKGRIYRQNIVFSEYNFPELVALRMNMFHNWQGSVANLNFYMSFLKKLPIELSSKLPQQNFYKISPKQPKDDLQFRLEFFKRKFWENLANNPDEMTKVLIFVNSYFEYVKLKSFFQRVNAPVQCVCEHTKKQKVQSRLSRFNNGTFRILLITQRAYFYGICQAKRFNYIYFYSLPKNSWIYTELLQNLVLKDLENSEEIPLKKQNRINCIYSKYDNLILERIVGSSKAIEMVKQYCNNVSFVI